MKNRVLTVALTFVVLQTLPCLGGQSARDEFNLNEWITYYYLHPQPDRTVEAILFMSAKGYLDKETAQSPLAAFFSQLFSQNPQSIELWFSKLEGLPNAQRRLLCGALWYSDTPQGLEQLKKEAARVAPLDNADIVKLTTAKPPSIASLEITAPSVLDMLWASFMATGDERYVIRIISTLPWVEEKNLNRLLIAGAARWSLTSNAIQHRKVLEICKAQVGKQEEKTVSILKEVLKQAETGKH
jgi:hypothetical protein